MSGVLCGGQVIPDIPISSFALPAVRTDSAAGLSRCGVDAGRGSLRKKAVSDGSRGLGLSK